MTEATNKSPVSMLEPKTKVTGKVVKTTLVGALVDIGEELPGVIHISQLQKDQVNKVEDVVKVGQSVEVWVRRIKKDRIELTMIDTDKEAEIHALVPCSERNPKISQEKLKKNRLKSKKKKNK